MSSCKCQSCKNIEEKKILNDLKKTELKSQIPITPPIEPISVPYSFDNNLNDAIKEIKSMKVVRMILGHNDIYAYYFGGGIRDHLAGVKPSDYDIVIISNNKVRGHIFQIINREYGGELKTIQGYRGTMKADSHVLVKFPGLDIVFVDTLNELKFDYNINSLYVPLKLDSKEYTWADVQALCDIKYTILDHILTKKMMSLFKVDNMEFDKLNNNPIHLLYRIINMHNKGYRDVKMGALVDFYKLYCMYKNNDKTKVISDAEIIKRQTIEASCDMMFKLMRDLPGSI